MQLGLYIVVFLAITSAQTKADPIHFDRVNSAMQVIADAVTQGDDMVEYAKPSFDEKFSDLKAERLRYEIKGELKNSPWLTGSRSEISGTSTLIADRSMGHLGIEVGSVVSVKTDSLALLREGATIALRKLGGSEPKFQARIRDSLKQLSEASTLKDVYEILVAGQALAVEVELDKIRKEREYLECLKAHQCGQANTTPIQIQIASQEKYVAQFEALQEGFASVQITAVPNTANPRKIVLLSKQPTKFALGFLWEVEPRNAKVEISEKEIVGAVDGFAPLKQKELDRLKTDLDNIVYKLQAGDLEMKEQTFRAFRDALFSFKEVIRGEKG